MLHEMTAREVQLLVFSISRHSIVVLLTIACLIAPLIHRLDYDIHIYSYIYSDSSSVQRSRWRRQRGRVLYQGRLCRWPHPFPWSTAHCSSVTCFPLVARTSNLLLARNSTTTTSSSSRTLPHGVKTQPPPIGGPG